MKTGCAVDTQAGAMIKSGLSACTLCPHPRLPKSGDTRDTMWGPIKRRTTKKSADESGSAKGQGSLASGLAEL